VGWKGEIVSVERLGVSAPHGVVMSEYGFFVDNVQEQALSVFRVTQLR
jgi:transketolase